MLTFFQRLAIRAAERALASAGVKVWFDLRVLHDSKKRLFGASMASGTLDELLVKLEARRVALRPECRLELRMYSTLVEKRGVFMGVDVEAAPERPGIVVGTAPSFDKWPRSHALRPRARAAGVVLEHQPEPGRIMSEAESQALAEQLLDTPVVSTAAGIGPLGVHVCNRTGPFKQAEPGGPLLPTCSICGVIQ